MYISIDYIKQLYSRERKALEYENEKIMGKDNKSYIHKDKLNWYLARVSLLDEIINFNPTIIKAKQSSAKLQDLVDKLKKDNHIMGDNDDYLDDIICTDDDFWEDNLSRK